MKQARFPLKSSVTLPRRPQPARRHTAFHQAHPGCAASGESHLRLLGKVVRFPGGSQLRLALLSLILLAGILSGPAASAAETGPVAYWGFGQEESTPLESHGSVHRDVPGPRPDTYPDFSPDNIAVHLDGQGARFIYKDPGDQSPFDFNNGDAITLEAWVRIDKINPGDNVYVIGKGRTGNPGFSRDNQNWALRVCEREGRIAISLLFSSIPGPGTANQKNWHRWISEQGFKQGPEWHHIAIAYRFGDPESLLGVIDGKQVTGQWDAGGPTRNPPTVDNDAIWIGSALKGTPSCSFRGDLDEIAIHRSALSLATLKTRYQGPEPAFAGGRLPEVMPELGNLPPGVVQLTFHDGLPTHTRWLNEGETVPEATLVWQTSAFLLDRLPQPYDAWGIRADWNGPVLVRMAADVSLPPGKHRFLMRVRSLSRLWINGSLIARGTPIPGGQDGFEPITPPAAPPKPGLRIAEHRQQEIFGNAVVGADGKCRVILETLVGGKKLRTDPGETCIAVETEDGTSFVLLEPTGKQFFPLTDEVVLAQLAAQSEKLQAFDDQRRRQAAHSEEVFWSKRHQFARQWAQEHPAPALPASAQSSHPIDAFLEAKIQMALAASAQTPLSEARQFHEQVLPVLRDNCFRCHGEKSQGGLRLNSLDSARKGGDSSLPAVEPGHAQESELISRIRSTSLEERMPPGDTPLTPEQITLLEKWIDQGAAWPAPPVTPEMVALPPVVSDEVFVRRIYLDTVGVIPTAKETRQFLQDRSPEKRIRLIDCLLADDRWADHWTSYWQDVLAENPTLINASLNTTGPFRWFIYDSLRDNLPFDRFVTELILLRGSQHEGGSAGFGIAANNDSPFAAKGQIVAGAFLGVELQCARCHDSPYHSTLQKDLYALAAMFARKPLTVPDSSQVPAAFFEKQQRASLIRVSLKPGEPVLPVWPFEEMTGSTDQAALAKLMHDPDDSREKLAACITSPDNQRFAQVIVNRVWRRYIGTGIVDSPDDWEGKTPSHPHLLNWLAHDFISHGYDLKHLARQVLTSQLYQRQGRETASPVSADLQFFVAPNRRRMSAEQVVDSLLVAVGKPMDVEEMTFAPEAGRPSSNRLSLGFADRAWKFANLANERDRPSLSLPRARALADILEAFGWNGARQNPRTDREIDPNVLQPGILQNSDAAVLLPRITSRSGLAEMAIESSSPDELLDQLFLSILNRLPLAQERKLLTPLLANGFDQRLLPPEEWSSPQPLERLPVVTWSNHVQPESNSIAIEMEQRARAGTPPDPRFRSEWREACEDVIWSLMNLSDFVWIP